MASLSLQCIRCVTRHGLLDQQRFRLIRHGIALPRHETPPSNLSASASHSRSQPETNSLEDERELQQLRGYIRAFKRRREQKDKTQADTSNVNDADDDSRRGK